jgi:Xaa-Pro aminopeptidase
VSASPDVDEATRVANLLDAQRKAELLFDAIAAQNLLRAGAAESQISEEIYALAKDQLGVTKHWHRRIVRSGPNTLFPYSERSPDRTLMSDDIAFLDLGPIFEEWEADFGRTYVLGDDPVKCKLRDDLEPCWQNAKQYFDSNPEITGAGLYDYVVVLARTRGWEFGANMAGHLIGEFPHDGLKPGGEVRRIWPQYREAMRGLDSQGRQLHWILELHFVDRERQIGGFYEQLLTV